MKAMSHAASIRLEAARGGGAPVFTHADVVPSRAMMAYQLGARTEGGREIGMLCSPPLEEGLSRLADRADRFGNAAFQMGGAFLAPFANRIRGRAVQAGHDFAADIANTQVRLRANGGGSSPGAEAYAIHGLILDRPATHLIVSDIPGGQRVTALIPADAFGGRWRSRAEVHFELALTPERFSATMRVANIGREAMAVGLGWHPYLSLPSGDRRQAKIRIPAAARLAVNDYDEVLPTGEILAVRDTIYDFGKSGGRRLDDLYLDDCFVHLHRADGQVTCDTLDPAAHYGVRISTNSPHIKAVQVYAPLDRPFVVVEPQFNWANPYGAEWGPTSADTGMVTVLPDDSIEYQVSVELLSA